MGPSVRIAVMLVILAALVLGCSSRYRKDLHFTIGEDRRRVKVVTTEFIPGVRLSNPYADVKVAPGAGSCLVLTTQTRGETVNTQFLQEFVQFDENLVCQIYLQLHPVPEPATIWLKGNSLVQMRGRYELSTEEKIFLPDGSGTLVVDSLSRGYLFGTIDGTFVNSVGTKLSYIGEFRAKVN